MALAALSTLTTAACGDGPDANSPGRSQLANNWLNRARQSYRSGDADDAAIAIDGALKAAPRDREARMLGARIALAKLEFEEAIKLSEGIQGSDAKAIRGRAFWYTGDIERAEHPGLAVPRRGLQGAVDRDRGVVRVAAPIALPCA
ncbi:MAG TPA: hypothetical protein VM925_33020, partial [Labilithrix sp.]|nr:hypothetical protein [Labilithrix sp.]